MALENELAALGMPPEVAKRIGQAIGVTLQGYDTQLQDLADSLSATAAQINSAATLVAALTATAAEINMVDGAVSTVTIALAASATTDGMDITVTAKDAAGATLAGVHELIMHISDATTGIGLTADAFSGDLTASVGAILGALTAKKAWIIQTAASGIFTATLVDSANPADVYVAVKKPISAGVVVSAASGVNWEGI